MKKQRERKEEEKRKEKGQVRGEVPWLLPGLVPFIKRIYHHQGDEGIVGRIAVKAGREKNGANHIGPAFSRGKGVKPKAKRGGKVKRNFDTKMSVAAESNVP